MSLLAILACPTGFEPAASRVGVLRAIQLRHGQMLTRIVYHTAQKNSSAILQFVQKYALRLLTPCQNSVTIKVISNNSNEAATEVHHDQIFKR